MSEILEKVGLKTCSKCEQTLPVSAFGKNKSSKDGLQGYCKLCQIKHKQEWRDENREHVNEHYREYRDKNRDHINEQQRQRRDENREHVNEYSREYRQDPENKRKNLVRSLTNAAIARGELIRPDACPQCGANDSVVEAHHLSYDYGEELNVMWLCRKCHTALHQRNKID